MTDDLHNVRPAAFTPVRPPVRTGTRKPLADHEDTSGEGRHDDAAGGEDERPTADETARKIEEANGRLAARALDARLRLAGTQAAPLVEVMVPDGAGGFTVARRFEPGGIEAWISRIETSEGLLLDERM